MKRPREVATAGNGLTNLEFVSIFAVPIITDDAPEWIELIPAGKFSAIDGRGPFENQDPESIVAASLAKMPQVGLVLDYDHSTDLAAPEGRPAPAAGWLKGFKVENGAIFARVEWTADAADALQQRKYRYVSPVFEHSKDGKVERILRAALTNNPALINLPALARSEDAGFLARQPRAGMTERTDLVGAALEPPSGVQRMAKKHGEKTKLSEKLAALEAAFPDATAEQHVKAASCYGALSDGEDAHAEPDGDEPADDNRDGPVQADAAEAPESAEAMAKRHEEEMARCANDDEKAECASRHEREKEEMAKRAKMYQQHRGLEMKGKESGGEPTKVSPAISSLIDAHLAKHPMMLAAQTEINKLRAERNTKQATAKVDAAIKQGRLIPSQREWAIEYCSADENGFDKFIGAQPKIIQSGSDNTFTARIGDPPKGETSLSAREIEICASLGLDSKEQLEKFASNKERWTLKFPRPRLMLDDTNSGKANNGAAQ